MVSTLKQLSPVAWAVIGTVWLLAFFGGLGLALSGSLILTQSAIKQAETKAAAAQIASAKRECIALKTDDLASRGVTFPNANKPGHPAELYLSREIRAVHQVYVASKCPQILAGTLKPSSNG